VRAVRPFISKNYFSPSFSMDSVGQAYNRMRIGFALILLLVSFFSLSTIILPIVTATLGTSGISIASVPKPSPTPFRYDYYYQESANNIYPVREFRIVIPKINLESQIVDNVDPKIEKEYKSKLQYGVAHAKGSYLPPENGGPVYLFAHSTDTIENIARFNAQFFSVRELENGDEIDVYFNGKKYAYIVKDKSVINPDKVDVIQNSDADLILQTCWPPGTDWQRLIVLADRVGEGSI
jgi:LPXTG-site transpeptidase (sortase) family protein